eukprot:CAMPEP_0119057770 /NCGR_PEP_ID=MMETSP1178-20130426/2168_1 /TAXON_ID=33656 /ORGANISM="unid sp, Strain CCMP2000" /LENGTH=201 /DNA_ID=CAMNT_0007038627 /DNA_START=183 /DNA_END=789 /DNA_ORIENTATION=+
MTFTWCKLLPRNASVVKSNGASRYVWSLPLISRLLPMPIRHGRADGHRAEFLAGSEAQQLAATERISCDDLSAVIAAWSASKADWQRSTARSSSIHASLAIIPAVLHTSSIPERVDLPTIHSERKPVSATTTETFPVAIARPAVRRPATAEQAAMATTSAAQSRNSPIRLKSIDTIFTVGYSAASFCVRTPLLQQERHPLD